MTDSKPTAMELKTLLRSIEENKEGGTRYAFLLGAGASISSGIPGANKLATDWLSQIEEDNSKAYKKLIEHDDYDPENIATLYSEVYRVRFQSLSGDGYRAIEKIMSDKRVWPSIGYSILAQVLNKTLHNLVITTNFDRLTETALLSYENVHARVIAHETMLDVIAIDEHQPSIVKVHNDMFFGPKSSKNEVEALGKRWLAVIKKILAKYHVIAIGYGGNDGGLMGKLEEALNENSDARFYWCHRGEQMDKFQEFPKQVVHVKIPSFDGMMHMLGEKLNYPLLSDQLIEVAEERKQVYEAQIEKLVKETKADDDKEVAEAITKLVASTWWEVERAVQETNDPDEKEALYRKGIEKFSESHELLDSYAIFLETIRKDYDGAERNFKKALESYPDYANANNNYAIFLQIIRKDYDEAEHYYKKALELEPRTADFNNNYGLFLETIRKDYVGAERYHKKALETNPYYASSNNNYANFLNTIRKDHDGAERYYKEALEDDPDHANANGNYGGLLLAGGRTDEAKPLLERAEKNVDQNDLKIELHFYRLAHFPEMAHDSRKAIHDLLEQGVRSPGWDFSRNIEQAEKDGCTYVEELRELAAKISEVE